MLSHLYADAALVADEPPRPVAAFVPISGSRLSRVLRGHPRSVAALLAGFAAYMALLPFEDDPTRAVTAWDVAALVFVGLSAILFTHSKPDDMPQEAERAQEGQWAVFWFTLLGVTFSFAAVFGEFSNVKELTSSERLFRVSLVVVTLLLSWLVMQTAFAFRYAHGYYERMADGRIRAGLDFPGDDEPDYWDFFYFSAVLGMTFQVSDVQIQTRGVRRMATAHGFLGFVFNTVIVALTVNLASGLL